MRQTVITESLPEHEPIQSGKSWRLYARIIRQASNGTCCLDELAGPTDIKKRWMLLRDTMESMGIEGSIDNLNHTVRFSGGGYIQLIKREPPSKRWRRVTSD